ncbi:MAG: hypothetical protein K9N10_19620 [Deltaproteobacteria bacterium]|nr:hypothetical protein [Deltaproteobacteria bacterium]
MEPVEMELRRYLKETLGIEVQPKEWRGGKTLPFYLRNLYAFFELHILNTSCLAMVVKDGLEQPPATVKTHISQVRLKWAHELIYVRASVTAYNRKRLIEQKVPFIVPGNQMYLPFLGIDLREHFKRIRDTGSAISPATQTVVLYALLHPEESRFTLKHLAQCLNYSAMSMTRALDELEDAKLGKITMEGRNRILCFDRDRETLWNSSLEKLSSPVKRRFWVIDSSDALPGVKAGLSALACYSRLAEPANPVIALTGKSWKDSGIENDLEILAVAEPEAYEVEIWSYAPRLFAENGVVDRFSLYLSLRYNEDERVALAMEKMMEQISW